MEKRRTTGLIVSVLGTAVVASAFLWVYDQRGSALKPLTATPIGAPKSSAAAPDSTALNSDLEADAEQVFSAAGDKPVATPLIPPPRTREELVKRAAEQRENTPFRDIFASARVVAARSDGTYPIASAGIAYSIVLPQSAQPQEITLRIEYPNMQSGEQAPLVRVAGTSGRFTVKSSTTENALLVYLPADKAQIGSYIMDINFLDRAREGQHRYLLNLTAAKANPH